MTARKQLLRERAMEMKEEADPVPMEGAGITSHPTLTEMVKTMVRHELSRAGVAEGYGSWEEENDFEDDFDDLPVTGYEEDYDPQEFFHPENPSFHAEPDNFEPEEPVDGASEVGRGTPPDAPPTQESPTG